MSVKFLTIDTTDYYSTVEKFLEDNKQILKNTPYNDVCRYMENEFGIKFESSNHPYEHSWNYVVVNDIKFNIAKSKYRIF
jgi:hypothetical protein